MSAPNTLRLFDSPVVGLISWYLVVYKELTAGQIAKLAKKNVSTITRNLGRMKKQNLVQVSRIKTVKNLQVKYWQINPDIVIEDITLNREEFNKLTPDQQQITLNRIENIILTFQGIIRSIFNYQLKKIREKKLDPESHIQIALLNKETGKIFLEEFQRFTDEFLREHDTGTAGFADIDLDSYIIFNLLSRVRDAVPLLKESPKSET